jgi:hypothetical protein
MAKHRPFASGQGSNAAGRSPKMQGDRVDAARGNAASAPPVAPPGSSVQRLQSVRGAEPQKKIVDSTGRTKTPGVSLLRQEAKPDDGGTASLRKPKQPVRQDYGTRPYYMRRLGALELERATWIQHWWELAEYMAPRRQRRFWNDRNRGVKRNEKIINNTALTALRTLSSGMHSGLTSPARPWFTLTTPDPRLADEPRVRSWLHFVGERMRLVLARSNIYNVLPQVYGDLGAFGTACLWLDEDPHEIVRGFVFPIGSYALGAGANQMIDSAYRRVSMSVSGVVDAFGYEHCSPKVQDLYDRGSLDQWVLLCQACEPNRAHNPGDATSKAWSNVWFELEEGADQKDFLKVSGYRTFPCCAPRWNVNGEDIYGYSPGMDALGDVRALQQLERRKLATADKIVNPPMVAPAALRNQRVTLLAGDTTYLDAQTPAGSRFEPALIIPPTAITVDEQSIQIHERRVKDAFFATLWMMISEDDRATPATAEEIRAKQDEKMLQLGPVLERLHDELLDPLIDRTFEIMLNRHMIPPPPPELQRAAENGDDELRVEYKSILAQAQKLVGIAALDRQVAFTGNLAKATGDSSVIDILDTDRMTRDHQEMVGTDPETLRSPEAVAAIREQRAAAQKAQADAEQAATAAQAAAHAGKAAQSLAAAPLNDPNGPSALTGLLGAYGPAAVAGGGDPSGGIGGGGP